MGSGMFFNVSQPAEEFQSGLDIESNLSGQKFRRIKSLLIPDAMKKLQSGRRGIRNGAPQHKCFDRRRVLAKRRANSDVGYGIEIFAAIERDSSDINTVSGYQLIGGIEIQCRYSHIAASPRPADNLSFNLVPASEQPRCPGNFAFQNSHPNPGTAGRKITKHHWRDFNQLEFAGPLPKRFHGAFLSMSKIEIGADTNRSNAKPFDQILAHERIW